MSAERRIVDNRVFLLGLDELYRAVIKRHERSELLQCAELVASNLSLSPADVPIEGYYSGDEPLTRYFRLIRALQKEPESRESEIYQSEAYARLKAVLESPIFGAVSDSPNGQLFRRGRNALYFALKAANNSLSIDVLTDAAHEIALRNEEFSLVSLGALAKDPVVMAALGESVVLYQEVYAFGIPEPAQYEWKVEPAVEKRAKQFVKEFNSLFAESLPEPCAKNAATFGDACNLEEVVGRCVRIAVDDGKLPVRYYHWAIDRDWGGPLKVTDFWDTSIWTTDRYRAHERDSNKRSDTSSSSWWRFWK